MRLVGGLWQFFILQHLHWPTLFLVSKVDRIYLVEEEKRMINGIPLIVLIAVGVTCLLGIALVVIKEVMKRQWKTPAYILWGVALIISFCGLFTEEVMVGLTCIFVGACLVVVSIPFKKAS